MSSRCSLRCSLLTLELDYSLTITRERGLEHNITSRDLNGFFEHVWSINPFVGADRNEPGTSSFGPPAVTAVSSRHTVIEGRVGYSSFLRRLPVTNFVLAQAALLVRLDRLVRREQIGIIRASEPYAAGLIGLFLARSNGRPYVVRLISNYDSEIYGNGAVFPRLFRRRSLEKRIDRFVLKRADVVAAGNEDIVRYALANGAGAERTTVFRIGHLVDPIHFTLEPGVRGDVRAELGIGDRPFAICVTRLVAIKHPEDVLRVLAEAKKQVPRLVAVIVGDGPMRPELETLAADLGVADDLIITGNRDQAWISRALTSSTVVLSPLTGRALVEATLSGTPVVAYDVDWHRELLRPGETGMLVPYRDTAEMAGALCTLVSNPDMAETMARRSRNFTMELMDPEKLMLHEQHEYERLLRDRRDGATEPVLEATDPQSD